MSLFQLDIKFKEIIDVKKLQQLMDKFYKATKIPIGIIDTDDEVLVGTGWQRICTHFHRVNSETKKRCHESDHYIANHLNVKDYVQYKCLNGLRDIAFPIMMEDRHLATLFVGQFFYDDEKPDYDFFINQANDVGFNQEEYINALEEVRIFTREEMSDILDFYKEFVSFISEMAYKAYTSELARYDYLTGIFSRKEGMIQMETLFKFHQRNRKPISIIMIDIDHFKQINDTLGHLEGDLVLKKFTSVTGGILRSYDIFFRYGGEEFVICLPETTKKSACVIAERVRTNILEADDLSLSAEFKNITVSCGIATFPDDAGDLNQLIELSDKALYSAKKLGRNRVASIS